MVQWLRLRAPTPTARVQSLVRELKPHVPSCVAIRKQMKKCKAGGAPPTALQPSGGPQCPQQKPKLCSRALKALVHLACPLWLPSTPAPAAPSPSVWTGDEGLGGCPEDKTGEAGAGRAQQGSRGGGFTSFSTNALCLSQDPTSTLSPPPSTLSLCDLKLLPSATCNQSLLIFYSSIWQRPS